MKRQLIWGLKARVLSLIIVPTLLVLLMFTLFIQRDMQNLQRDFEGHGDLIANQVAIASEYGAITENMDTLKDAVRSVIKARDVDGVVVLSPEQEAYVEEGYVRFIKEIPSEYHKPYICHSESSFAIFCAPILYTPFEVSDFEDEQIKPGGRVFIGSVQVSVSTRVLSEKRGESITFAVAFILFTIISTLLMARRIDGQIIAPILELTGVVNEIGKGELDQRVVLKSKGEINLLQDGVNHMAVELNSYQTDMESKVESATEELRSTLNELTIALSEIEQKNEELEVAWSRAEEASQAKSLFLAAMSHEIRTPLSGMLGMLDLVEQGDLSSLQRDQIHNIEQASAALKSLIDDILDFSRIEAGKLNIVNKPFSVRGLVDEIVTMFNPSVQMKGLEFVVDIDSALPMKVIGDSLRTRQVLINILSNAIKFTEKGWVIFRINVVQPLSSTDMVSVCFEIEDSGIGIPAERHKNVFERFSQVEQGREREYEGSGLGATTARQLVELMGGKISLTSEEGDGSHFEINLSWPVDTMDESRSESHLFEGERILVAEDNEESGAVVKRYLEDFGAEVTLIHTLEELENSLSTPKFERIVVSDAFDNDITFSYLQILNRPFPSDRRVQLGIASSFSGDELPDSSAQKYDFRWIKPVTPERIERSFSFVPDLELMDKSHAGNSQLSLLVAEDDEINAKVVIFFLEKRGHQVTHVTNGKDALYDLYDKSFDALFMDIRMPGMSGLEATKLWRQHEKGGHGKLPIVALTANDSEHDLSIESGMDGFILKPINNEKLDQLASMVPGL
ncbi:MAG: response regulator [Gammaproteobacteria bacterium]|nr:response regulator [Gammaproteobacteria bacterium]